MELGKSLGATLAETGDGRGLVFLSLTPLWPEDAGGGWGGLCGFPVSSVLIPLASQLPQHEAGVGGWCRRSAREPVARRQLPEQPHPLHLHVLRAAP